jgi:hypothetical protein
MKTGLVVAWLARIDVTGARGVIDQWFTLRGATLRGALGEAWRLARQESSTCGMRFCRRSSRR